MTLDIGFHVHSETAVEHHGTFDTEMSVVEFLRRVRNMEDVPYDITVYGLDTFLRGTDEPLTACEFIHEILRDRVNFLLNKNPRVQFVVEDVEYWDEPVLRDGDAQIPLSRIFRGIGQEGPGWFHSHINVQS